MPTGTGPRAILRKAHPTRYFDVGIAEEHAALFAAGLAAQGFKPFLAIYSTFMQRAYDMIIHDIALQNLNVALCMDRGGLSGDDGPTHHGLFDIGYLRHMPGLVHMQPKDEEEFVRHALDHGCTTTAVPSPSATRAAPAPACQPKAQPKLLEIGKAEVVSHGSTQPLRVAIFGLGGMCADGRGSRTRQLEEPRGSAPPSSTRAGSSRSTPRTIEFFARSVDVVCTIEDHVLHNGFGCAVIEHLSTQRITTPVVRIGWPDQFVEHGSPDILRKKHGLTVENTVKTILAALPAKAGAKSVA